MKYMSEYRDPELAKKYLEEIKKNSYTTLVYNGGLWRTNHSLVKNGIIEMLPKTVTMIHGPGCPVCVTPLNIIDKAIHLALEENVILCSFGDMLRVPGSKKKLTRSQGRRCRYPHFIFAIRSSENRRRQSR